MWGGLDEKTNTNLEWLGLQSRDGELNSCGRLPRFSTLLWALSLKFIKPLLLQLQFMVAICHRFDAYYPNRLHWAMISLIHVEESGVSGFEMHCGRKKNSMVNMLDIWGEFAITIVSWFDLPFTRFPFPFHMFFGLSGLLLTSFYNQVKSMHTKVAKRWGDVEVWMMYAYGR